MTDAGQLEATVKAIAEHDAAFAGANLMYLKGGTKDHFLGFIAREFPHMLQGFEQLYTGAYAPRGYISSIRAMVDALQKRYDVGPRGAAATGEDEENDEAAPRQAAFEW